MRFKLVGSITISLILYASYLLILLSLPYLAFERGVDFLATKELIYHLDWWRISFYVHVFSSPFVIVSGLIQFIPYFILKAKKVHKFSGYIYLVFVLFLAGPSGLLISLYANGGYPTQISFTLLSILWIGFTLIAFLYLPKKNWKKHSDWMTRSYALTLSAVTLRLYAYLFDVFRVDLGPIETYQLISILSWPPNLLMSEILIYFGFTERLLRPSQ